jgi:predicted alpha/beta-hydrolase family hydrolase
VVAVCEGLAQRGHAAMRFNFLYKERGHKAPDPRARLERTYRAAVEAFRDECGGLKSLVIGGKSLGGRIASHLAAAGEACDGLVFLGYPLHPAREPERLRDGHLTEVEAPMLFVQGTRDPLCDLELLRIVLDRLGRRATLHEVAGGDHSFGLLKSANRSVESVYEEIVATVDRWLVARFGGKV